MKTEPIIISKMDITTLKVDAIVNAANPLQQVVFAEYKLALESPYE